MMRLKAHIRPVATLLVLLIVMQTAFGLAMVSGQTMPTAASVEMNADCHHNKAGAEVPDIKEGVPGVGCDMDGDCHSGACHTLAIVEDIAHHIPGIEQFMVRTGLTMAGISGQPKGPPPKHIS